jgi:hypothetical protein
MERQIKYISGFRWNNLWSSAADGIFLTSTIKSSLFEVYKNRLHPPVFFASHFRTLYHHLLIFYTREKIHYNETFHD